MDEIIPYFQNSSVTIYNEDFLTINLLEGGIDLIITSPPYNLDKPYPETDDNITYDEYLSFSRKWLLKALSLMKPDGRMCLNIALDRIHNSIYSDILQVAKTVGWKYYNSLIWYKGVSSRTTQWGSFCSASAPCSAPSVEMIMLLYKDQWKKRERGQSSISKEEFVRWSEGFWKIIPERAIKNPHVAPFPEELPYRCIKLFSYIGDVVLDPFMGSGTTLLSCLKNGRKGIGVEISKQYCDMAIKRLEKRNYVQTSEEWMK